MNKDRGKFLTVMIVFAAIGYLQALYYLTNTNLITQAYGTVPSWFSIYQIAALLVGVSIIFGLWMMSKWSVYLLALSTVIAFAMQLFVLKPILYAQFTYMTTIFSAALWFWAISRKWKSFT